jgi:hypothetical protein
MADAIVEAVLTLLLIYYVVVGGGMLLISFIVWLFSSPRKSN